MYCQSINCTTHVENPFNLLNSQINNYLQSSYLYIAKIPPKFIRTSKSSEEDSDGFTLEYSQIASECGLSEYPIRNANEMEFYQVVKWKDTPLGSSSVWSYQPRGIGLDSIGYPPVKNTEAENEQLLKLHTGLPYVQVFYY